MKIIPLLIICLVIVSFVYVISANNISNDFFEENNIGDTTPIGKDLGGYWIYQTRDKQIIKTLDYPTTPEGIKYAKLTEVNK